MTPPPRINTVSSNRRIYLRESRRYDRFTQKIALDGTYTLYPAKGDEKEQIFVVDRCGRIALKGAKPSDQYVVVRDPDGVYSLMPIDFKRAAQWKVDNSPSGHEPGEIETESKGA